MERTISSEISLAVKPLHPFEIQIGKCSTQSHLCLMFINVLCSADHDTEWVYREHGLTSLAEVSQRIGDYCRQVGLINRLSIDYYAGCRTRSSAG